MQIGSVVVAAAVAAAAIQQEQFWLNWYVQLATAVATVLAVVVALFGPRLQSLFFRPSLQLSLLDPMGEFIWAYVKNPETGTSRPEMARYFHLRVSTRKAWPPATGVQVIMTRLEVPSADGSFVPIWSAEVPTVWRNQEANPAGVSRTIGPQYADCDLLSAVRGKWIELHPMFAPNNLQTRYREPTKFIVHFQARGNESLSPVLRVRVDWDGQWEDGGLEMSRHLSVKVVL